VIVRRTQSITFNVYPDVYHRDSGVIFIGATPDRMFRAYDSVDGSILWSTELPAAGFATPAVYSVDGQQFVVIAAGGGRMGPPSSSQYLAYSLPNNENDN